MATYIVQDGDSINGIAAAAGITREELIRRNPELAGGRGALEVGAVLNLGRGNRVTSDQAGNLEYQQSLGNDFNPNAMELTQPWLPLDDPFTDLTQPWMVLPGPPAPTPDPLPGPGGGGTDEEPVPGGSADNPDTGAQNPDVSGGGAADDFDPQSVLDMVRGSFSWITNLGLDGMILDLIRNQPGISPTAIIENVRGTSQWQAMFPNIRRDDGTLRMNEGTYLSQVDNYRQVLNRFGFIGEQYSNAQISNFFANEIDLGELQDRLTIYDQIQRGSADLRAAFYVYAGISLSDDDIFDMIVDPDAADGFTQQYYTNQQGLDYGTFLGRVADIATQQTGSYVGRDAAVGLLDQLLHGGDPVNGDFLSLAELQAAFDAAMIGSTATAQGLSMPDFARIEEFRLAGVNRVQALQRYGEFARDQNLLNAIVQRSSGSGFSQSNFEAASFLSDPEQQRRMQRGLAQEAARSQGGQSFSFNLSGGLLQQQGMSAFRS